MPNSELPEVSAVIPNRNLEFRKNFGAAQRLVAVVGGEVNEYLIYHSPHPEEVTDPEKPSRLADKGFVITENGPEEISLALARKIRKKGREVDDNPEDRERAEEIVVPRPPEEVRERIEERKAELAG